MGRILRAVVAGAHGLPLCFALCVLFSSSALAQEAGRVGEAQGAPEILRPGQTAYNPLQKGDKVSVGETVTTKETSKVWLHLNDNSDISLGGYSSILLNDFTLDPQVSNVHAHAAQGIIRFIEKLPNTLPPSTYTVTTPTAIISVEQTNEATDFVIQAASTAQSSVSVIWGAVLVKSLTEGIAVERIVKSCQMVYVDEGKEPSP